MIKYLLPGLAANAASLGYNWMYHTEYLQSLEKKKDLLFQKPNEVEYREAGKSYFAYPNAEIGSVTTQGMFMKWLYKALKNHPELNRDDYEKLIYDHIGPGGSYHGYVETYGKKMIVNVINRELKLGMPDIKIQDDHLVGFIPYLVCKELGLSQQTAIELSSLFTDRPEYEAFFEVFDAVFEGLKTLPLKDALMKSIDLAPKHYKPHLEAAIHSEDTLLFVKDHAGISCHIPYSLPVIFHLLAHATTFEDLVRKNTVLGGASSDRGLLLGAIMHQVSPVPPAWIDMLK